MINFVSSPISKKYMVYVTWVDHGTYVKDARSLPALSNFSSEVSRNFHITGFRLDNEGGYFNYNVVIPQEIQGSFKVPQIGDVITVEEDPRYLSESPVYVYSIYNDVPYTESISANIPNWGSIPGDYGHLRSHTDHNLKFNPGETSFTKRYIKSITGYRFRKFYGHVFDTQDRFLEEGKFAVRGDVVFDIEGGDSMSRDEIEAAGVNVVSINDNDLSDDLSSYPNPLNVPILRATDERFSYASYVPRYLPAQVESDPYKGISSVPNVLKDEFYVDVFKNKNYFSYTPIMDKKYNDYLISVASEWDPSSGDAPPEPFLRELPAAEEYQVSLRGNNKLLIQDQYGDGEQLLITLKNQYDSGFTILHNAETSQIRIRDHLGQGVLLEGDPEHPRVISWTTERQVIDMGAIREYNPDTGETKSFGEYLYLRNGSVYGKSDTNFGRITESEIPRDGSEEFPVPQQEFMLISSQSAGNLAKLLGGISSRLSSGMNSLLSASNANGLFFRNNYDPKESKQTLQMTSNFDEIPELKTRFVQEHFNGTFKSDVTQVVSDTEVSDTSSLVFNNLINNFERYINPTGGNVTKAFQSESGIPVNKWEMDETSITSTRYYIGEEETSLKQAEDLVSVNRYKNGITINLGAGDSGNGIINIGHTNDTINIGSNSSLVNVKANGLLSIGSSTGVNITAPIVNVNEGDGG
jgi:hypothetical protein